MIFVNSMSDLFHKDIPKAHITAVFDTMEKADWHIYQVLTKRSSLLQEYVNDRYRTRKAPANMWFGVSVENRQATSRIAHLKKANVSVRFLSIEPLIASVGRLDLSGIDWVIVGGESGPAARPMNPEWAIDVRNQCRCECGILFQAVGRTLTEDRRAIARRPGMEPVSQEWATTQCHLELLTEA
jgi:protein gp37